MPRRDGSVKEHSNDVNGDDSHGAAAHIPHADYGDGGHNLGDGVEHTSRGEQGETARGDQVVGEPSDGNSTNVPRSS